MSSSTAASKKLQYANLYAQLDQLNKNITLLNKNVDAINEQAPIVQKIGIVHTAMTMSATKVLNKTDHLEKFERQRQQ